MKDKILEKDGLDLYIWDKHLDGIDPNDLPMNSDGQIVIHTGIYRWEDGSFHTTKEFKPLSLSDKEIKEIQKALKELDNQ